MSDKSNWKNKNRDILKLGTVGEFRKKIGIDQEGKPHSSGKGRAAAATRHFTREIKKIAKPFMKEAIHLEKFKKKKTKAKGTK